LKHKLCSANEEFQHAPIRPSFSSFEKGDGVGFFLFSMCAHELFNGFHEFSMYSPTCSSLPPICFAQSWPLGTYITRRISHNSMLAMKSSVWGKCLRFQNLFLWWANQRGSLQKKTWAWKAPQTNYYRSQYISIKMWYLMWWNRADIKMMASCVRILYFGRPCGF